MKQFLIVFIVLIGLPVFADVIIEGDGVTKTFKENSIANIETTTKPSYGIIVKLKSGYTTYIPGTSRANTRSMYQEAYSDLQDYYYWSSQYYDKIIKENDKANLGVYCE